MDAIRKKVLNELFLAPSAVLPMVAGASAWLISWGLGGVTALTVGGLVAILGGAGWMATRIIFQLDAITERTMRFAEEKRRQSEEARIKILVDKLGKVNNQRALDYLTILRENRREFEELAGQTEMQARGLQLVGQVRQLFWATIERLEQSFKLSELAGKLRSIERQEIVARNEQALAEVKATADRLMAAVEHLRKLSLREQNSDLSELRDELDESLEVARQTELRMNEIEKNIGYERHLKE